MDPELRVGAVNTVATETIEGWYARSPTRVPPLGLIQTSGVTLSPSVRPSSAFP